MGRPHGRKDAATLAGRLFQMSNLRIMNISPTQSTAVGEIDDLTIIKDTALKLLAYCKANEWAGYDPYDALNSRVFIRPSELWQVKISLIVLSSFWGPDRKVLFRLPYPRSIISWD